MATKLDKNVKALSEKLGRELEILHMGVTGGYWPNGTKAIAVKSERSNCAEYIKSAGIEEHDQAGAFWQIRDAYVVTGAGVGGCRGRRAKQVRYAIVRPIEG